MADLNPQNLLSALEAAASPDHTLVQQASAQLALWEKQRGFYPLIHEAYLTTSLPRDLRLVAIIQLKYGIDKYWRKTAINALLREEKEQIRGRLLSGSLSESQDNLASQNALAIAKAGRWDYPLEWPEIFSELSDLILASENSRDLSEDLQLRRSLQILLQLVKELCTGRLVKTRTALQNVTKDGLFELIGNIYVRKVTLWLPKAETAKSQDEIESAIRDMKISLYCLKIQRRLLVSGFEFPNRPQMAREFWTVTEQHIQTLLTTTTREEKPLNHDTEIWTFLQRHLVALTKLHLDLAESQPAAWALMPNMLNGMQHVYWTAINMYGSRLEEQSSWTQDQADSFEGTYRQATTTILEKVALRGILLLRAAVKMIFKPSATFKYRHPEEKDELRISRESLRAELFTKEFVPQVMGVLVTKYLPLGRDDLSAWEDDGENWSSLYEETSESWEFMPRIAAEKLFMDMAVWWKDELTPALIAEWHTFANVDNHDVLLKDAVYNAVGLAANSMWEKMDFNESVMNTLRHEVAMTLPNYHILRRRIAILISLWAPVNIPAEARPTCYDIACRLLKKSDPFNDLVVRLTTGRNLIRALVDEIDFLIQPFMPYAETIIDAIIGLLSEVEQEGTRMSLLSVIALIVERLGEQIFPFAERIVNILPGLWDGSEDMYLYKQKILDIFDKLVMASKDQSASYHPMVIPLIQYSVDPANGQTAYLFEDAVQLWQSAIMTAPSPTPALMSLVPYILPSLEMGTESLKNVLEILEGYVLLAPREILNEHLDAILTALASILDSLKPEGVTVVTHVLELITRCAASTLPPDPTTLPSELAVPCNQAALAHACMSLHKSGCLGKILLALRDAHDASLTSGPNVRRPQYDAIVLADYLCVLSRIALASPYVFTQLLSSWGDDDILEWLLTQWFNSFSNISQPSLRKLNCLALTRMLEMGETMLMRLQDLMNVWTDVVSEINEAESGDVLLYYSSADDPNAAKIPHGHDFARRTELRRTDPIFTVHLSRFIAYYLTAAKDKADQGSGFDFWMSNVDKDVVDGFRALGIV